jgi:MYXO-CTERM domain-containing protein
MSQHKRIRSLLPVGVALALGLVNTSVQAAPSQYYELVADCDQQEDNCGPRGENDGPGHEQAKGAWFTDAAGAPWVGVVVMSAKDIPNRDEGPYQCRYFAWKIDAERGPQRMVDGLLLTNNRGNRPCNHPDLQYAGDGKMLFMFGTNDDNNANVQPYAQMLDAMTGNPLAGRTNLGDNNGNDGAGTAIMLKTGASLDTLALPTAYPKRFVYCYNDNGNNADCTVAQINENQSVNIVARINDVIDPANIPRPFMAQITPTGQFAVVAAKGDERPPEDGAYVRVIDVANPGAGDNGRLTGQMALMKSNEGARLYANSPEIAVGPTPGTFWALNTTSHQEGDNEKGTSLLYGHVVQFGPDYGLQILSTKAVGHYQSHAALCTSTHGPDGVQAGVLIESSISNSGPGVATPMYYDANALSISEGPAKVTTPYTADSGELANLYGNNPNTQGRDFVSCIGSVANPGYGIETGWQNETQSFIVTASYGMMSPDDYKNSMFLTFVPAHTPNQTLPPDTPNPDDGDDGNDDVPDDDGDGVPNDQDPDFKSGSSGGCSTAGAEGSALGGLFLLLGAFLVVRRRRG